MVTRTLAAGAVATALATPGCFAPLHQSHGMQSEPFQPAAKNSDLVFVRTRDRSYYYILDKARRLCFFHAPIYGAEHLVSLDCDTFPDYDRLVAQATAKDHVAPDAETPGSDSPAADVATPEPSPPAADAPAPSEDPRKAFRRAYVQFECGKREGAEEPLEQVLARFQLSADTWDTLATEFEADDAAWNELEAEVNAACPAGKTPTKAK